MVWVSYYKDGSAYTVHYCPKCKKQSCFHKNKDDKHFTCDRCNLPVYISRQKGMRLAPDWLIKKCLYGGV